MGVEVFFVITGYFFCKSFINKCDREKLVPFLANRIVRLWPLTLFICLGCLILGFFTMLPDDFENLGESVVASSVFVNNILSAITTKNYWNFSNNYKPLMHLWYVGVLIHGNIFLAVVFKLFNKIGRNILKTAVVLMAFASCILFFLPYFSDGDKFYYSCYR